MTTEKLQTRASRLLIAAVRRERVRPTHMREPAHAVLRSLHRTLRLLTGRY